MTNFYEDSAQTLTEERALLKSVRVVTLDDDQIAKMRASNADLPVKASLEVKVTPLSYRLEGGAYGNERTDYIPMTFGSLDYSYNRNTDTRTPTPEVLDAVRAVGYRGIPENLMIKISQGKKPEAARRYYERFVLKAQACGLALRINEGEMADLPVGQMYSPDEGQIVIIDEGREEFPTWDGDAGNWQGDPIEKFVRYIIGKDPSYVQPAEVRVVHVQAAESTTPAPTAAGGTEGPSVEDLKTAVEAAGWVGQPFEKFASAALQIRAAVQGAQNGGPALAHPEVMTAAQDGRLLEYLAEAGVIAEGGESVELS